MLSVLSPLAIPSSSTSDCLDSYSSRERLLNYYKGTQVTIPDLFSLFPGWEFKLNKHYPAIKQRTNEWTREWLDDDRIHSIEAADFAALAGAFFPDADEEEYLVAAQYHVWVFVWDDDLDCGVLTSSDIALLQTFKDQTDAVLSYSLGPRAFSGRRPPFSMVMEAFSEFCQKIVADSTFKARQVIYNEVQKYCDAAIALPLRRQADNQRLLDVPTFLEQRRGSGGCAATVALLLYLHHLDIPDDILDHEVVKTICEEACLIVHLCNDIASFAKELRAGQLDNIVPVLSITHNISLQDAIDRACDLVIDSRQKLESAEKRLPVPTGNPDLDEQIRRYVLGCKQVAAGNVTWSYMTPRYFGRNPVRNGNCVTLEI